MNYTVLTTFSDTGSGIYARDFIETFLEHWPEDVRLHVVHEGRYPHDLDDPRVTYRNLLKEQGQVITDFHAEIGRRYHTAYSSDRRWGLAKWARKVFALTHNPPDTDWLIWMDADVHTHAPVTQDWLDRVLPKDAALSFLDRDNYTYSECGFVGYRLNIRETCLLLQEMREVYLGGEVWDFAEYGDSYVFDYCRRQIFGTEWKQQHRLTPPGCTKIHPWPESILAECLTHEKGPVRKQRKYGATC